MNSEKCAFNPFVGVLLLLLLLNAQLQGIPNLRVKRSWGFQSFRLGLNAHHPLIEWCSFLQYLKIYLKIFFIFNLKLSACKGLWSSEHLPKELKLAMKWGWSFFTDIECQIRPIYNQIRGFCEGRFCIINEGQIYLNILFVSNSTEIF